MIEDSWKNLGIFIPRMPHPCQTPEHVQTGGNTDRQFTNSFGTFKTSAQSSQVVESIQQDCGKQQWYKDQIVT